MNDEERLIEAVAALRWIANNVKPQGPESAHAANALRRMGLPVTWPRGQWTPPGHDCERCGASLEECERRTRRDHRGCCAGCHMTDTHGMTIDDWTRYGKIYSEAQAR